MELFCDKLCHFHQAKLEVGIYTLRPKKITAKAKEITYRSVRHLRILDFLSSPQVETHAFDSLSTVFLNIEILAMDAIPCLLTGG